MVIRLIGEMDQENVGNLRNKLIKIIEEKNVKNMVINMEKLEFMDSTGIGIIIGRYNQLKTNKKKLYVTNTNEQINKLFKISGIYTIIDQYELEKEVVK